MLPEDRQALPASDTLTLGDFALIIEREFDREVRGSVLRIGDGPRVLAIGNGTLAIRLSEDGTPFFAPDDPRALFVVPVDRPVTECAPGTFAEPFDPPTVALLDASRYTEDALRVKRVVRDINGCRFLDLGDERTAPIMKMRACVPDELYPFADDERDVHVARAQTASPSRRFRAYG